MDQSQWRGSLAASHHTFKANTRLLNATTALIEGSVAEHF
jgi:hypothetical protein